MISKFARWIAQTIKPTKVECWDDQVGSWSTQKVESGDVVEDSITINGETFMVRGLRAQQIERCEAFVEYVKDDRLKFGYLDCYRVLQVVRSDLERNEGCHEST